MIQELNWDSDFFGWKTGLIKFTENLDSELKRATELGYRLLYVFCSENYFLEEIYFQKFDVKLVDQKVLYSLQLPVKIDEANYNSVVEYTKSVPAKPLYDLAFESGKYSRFRIDSHFDDNQFERMYSIWIEESINRKIADYVYITNVNEVICGMVTLKLKCEIAHIGLIAIKSGHQGKGLGRQLIYRCIATAIENNCSSLEVPTQINNNIACKFYESCGFKKDSTTNIYHFWLK